MFCKKLYKNEKIKYNKSSDFMLMLRWENIKIKKKYIIIYLKIHKISRTFHLGTKLILLGFFFLIINFFVCIEIIKKIRIIFIF